MGSAMAHYSMGFAMHYSKEKFRKLSPKTDTCDCRLHFHSAWNVFCIAALLQTLPQHIFEMLVFGLKIFILVKKFEGSQKERKKEQLHQNVLPRTIGLERKDVGREILVSKDRGAGERRRR